MSGERVDPRAGREPRRRTANPRQQSFPTLPAWPDPPGHRPGGARTRSGSRARTGDAGGRQRPVRGNRSPVNPTTGHRRMAPVSSGMHVLPESIRLLCMWSWIGTVCVAPHPAESRPRWGAQAVSTRASARLSFRAPGVIAAGMRRRRRSGSADRSRGRTPRQSSSQHDSPAAPSTCWPRSPPAPSGNRQPRRRGAPRHARNHARRSRPNGSRPGSIRPRPASQRPDGTGAQCRSPAPHLPGPDTPTAAGSAPGREVVTASPSVHSPADTGSIDQREYRTIGDRQRSQRHGARLLLRSSCVRQRAGPPLRRHRCAPHAA